MKSGGTEIELDTLIIHVATGGLKGISDLFNDLVTHLIQILVFLRAPMLRCLVSDR